MEMYLAGTVQGERILNGPISFKLGNLVDLNFNEEHGQYWTDAIVCKGKKIAVFHFENRIFTASGDTMRFFTKVFKTLKYNFGSIEDVKAKWLEEGILNHATDGRVVDQ